MSIVSRSCNFCSAVFMSKTDGEYDDEKTLKHVKEHLEICTKDNLYLDDSNAVYYENDII